MYDHFILHVTIVKAFSVVLDSNRKSVKAKGNDAIPNLVYYNCTDYCVWVFRPTGNITSQLEVSVIPFAPFVSSHQRVCNKS